MDIPEKVEEIQIQLNENNSKQNNTSSEIRKFNIELTVAQVHALSKLLPTNYSLIIERQNKNKRNNKKRQNTYKKDQITNLADLQQPSQRTKRVPSYRYTQQIVQLNNYSRASSQAYPSQIDDTMKPCLRILQMLKSHKSSWPFRVPVDPVALNIPNYLLIIKQPMDLQTVQQNLKNKVYLTASQFHADINKIIKNSYQFNKHNAQFTKFTSDFQKYYLKISNQSTNNRSYSTQSISNGTSFQMNKINSKMSNNKGSQSKYNQINQSNPVTLVQKKNLAQEIKKLPKQYLAEVAEIVYEGKTPTSQELDLQNLATSKIRQLQRLVRQKMTYLKINQTQRHDLPAMNQNRSDQSSFEEDSDS